MRLPGLAIAFALLAPLRLLAQIDPDPGSGPDAVPPALGRGAVKDGPLVLGLELGIGAESETGLPWAVEPSLALDADWDRYYARIELSQAFGELDWQRVLGYRVLDTAGMAVGWRPELADRLDLRLEAFSRYRSFGGAGYEARFGALALLQAGAMRGEAGPFFIAGAGYSRLMTRYSGTAVSQWDNDPLARIGFGWRDGRRLVLDMAISDYTGADASLWLKTFFEFGGRLAFGEGEAPEARATLVLKYSDFFTLTSYLDGFALRLSMSLPLGSPAWSAGLTGI